MLLKKLIPHDYDFFGSFVSITHEMVSAAKLFVELTQDLTQSKPISERIHDHEHRADRICHETMDELHRTFITPIDRLDIHSMMSRLDDIVDSIHSAAQKVNLYEIRSISPAIKEIASICLQSCLELKDIVELFHSLKNPEPIMEKVIRVHALENQGDALLRQELSRLFREEDDFKKFTMQKELIEILEKITDQCEAAGELVETILLEYA